MFPRLFVNGDSEAVAAGKGGDVQSMHISRKLYVSPAWLNDNGWIVITGRSVRCWCSGRLFCIPEVDGIPARARGRGGCRGILRELRARYGFTEVLLSPREEAWSMLELMMLDNLSGQKGGSKSV